MLGITGLTAYFGLLDLGEPKKGETVVEQTDIEVPKSWSQLATNVVVSKYFRGHIGTPERERSATSR